MPEINANNNTHYGGNLINQKYSPLQNINLDGGDQPAFYGGIFTGRIQALANAGIFPRKLKLYANWNPAPPAPPANLAPPMIVISSKRAWWLKSLFINMATKANVTGYNDPLTFNEGPVPWYAPIRSGRHCYIVVNSLEYDYYVSALKDANRVPFPNVTVVGFEYVADRSPGIGGFGASRYAALAMAIQLGYPQAWLVDDNVVHVNGFPNVLATVEANMNNAMWAIGFGGATNNSIVDELYGENRIINFATNYNFGGAGPGLLQQVVLWNLGLLAAHPLNMSPYFATSNEDVSLANYLQRNALQERVVTSCSIIKLSPDDNIDGMSEAIQEKRTASARLVSRSFNRTAQLFYNSEKNLNIINQQTKLFDYVCNTILPNSLANANNEFTFKLVTESRAVEQTLSAAVSRGWALANIFNPYNGFIGLQFERVMAQ